MGLKIKISWDAPSIRESLARLISPTSTLENRFIGTSTQSLSKTRKAKSSPLVGYKAARLFLMDGKIAFLSPTYLAVFYVEATSKCLGVGSAHLHSGNFAPTCTCGFYSFKNKSNSEIYGTHNEAVLETVLSGQFIEYTEGYRAEKQRVRKVTLHECYFCYEAPVALIPTEVVSKTEFIGLDGVCIDHVKSNLKSKLFTFEEASNMTRVGEDFKHALPTFGNADKNVLPLTREEIDSLQKAKRKGGTKLGIVRSYSFGDKLATGCGIALFSFMTFFALHVLPSI